MSAMSTKHIDIDGDLCMQRDEANSYLVLNTTQLTPARRNFGLGDFIISSLASSA